MNGNKRVVTHSKTLQGCYRALKALPEPSARAFITRQFDHAGFKRPCKNLSIPFYSLIYTI